MNEINLSHTYPDRLGYNPPRQGIDNPAVYEIKVAQTLSAQWAAWFDGMDLSCDDQGNTLLTGTIVDQSALHGILAKIRDLHLILLFVRRK